MPQAPRHLISIHDLTAAEVAGLFRLAADVKARPEAYGTALSQRSLAMIFEKSSTRTRVSFEVGMVQMGGHALFLSSRDIQLGRGEPIEDTARVLSRYVDGIMARTFAHQTVTDLAQYGTVPVINGLTDDLHPCQGLTDYFTLREVFGDLAGRKIAYVGDGNNMAHSLLFGASKVGMDIAVASPAGYQVKPRYADLARQDAAAAGTKIELTQDPRAAVAGASAVYTDVWASMGQEGEAEERLRAFHGFIVDEALMSAARPDAVFLHCLPAHRGEEVSAGVADGPQSRIFDEAENRLHVQKAIMLWLMGGVEIG
jgi:ornithine carbamoyltransferase